MLVIHSESITIYFVIIWNKIRHALIEQCAQCTPTRKCLAESEARLVENIQSSFPSTNLNLIRNFARELRLKQCKTFLEIVNKMKRIELYFQGNSSFTPS